MEPIIKVEGLQKHFGSVKAVKGIDFAYVNFDDDRMEDMKYERR